MHCQSPSSDSSNQTSSEHSCENCGHETPHPTSLKLLRWCSGVTFLVGAFALITAWISVYENGSWQGLKSDVMFFNAIAFFLLSIIADRRREDGEQKIMMAMMAAEEEAEDCSNEGCCGGGCCDDKEQK